MGCITYEAQAEPAPLYCYYFFYGAFLHVGCGLPLFGLPSTADNDLQHCGKLCVEQIVPNVGRLHHTPLRCQW